MVVGVDKAYIEQKIQEHEWTTRPIPALTSAAIEYQLTDWNSDR